MNEEPGSSLIRASRSESVRRAGHGLDDNFVPRDDRAAGRRLRASGRVAPVDPERDPSSVVRILELDTSEAILVPLGAPARGADVVEPARQSVFNADVTENPCRTGEYRHDAHNRPLGSRSSCGRAASRNS